MNIKNPNNLKIEQQEDGALIVTLLPAVEHEAIKRFYRKPGILYAKFIFASWKNIHDIEPEDFREADDALFTQCFMMQFPLFIILVAIM